RLVPAPANAFRSLALSKGAPKLHTLAPTSAEFALNPAPTIRSQQRRGIREALDQDEAVGLSNDAFGVRINVLGKRDEMFEIRSHGDVLAQSHVHDRSAAAAGALA